MSLSRTSLETLIDLVEIKLSCMEVFDRDDAKEMARLQQCARELAIVKSGGLAADGGAVTPFPERRRGRRPKALGIGF